MATTFTRILIHAVFSTKHRAELIRPEIELELWNYMEGIISHRESKLVARGGTTDHVHLLVSMGKRITIVDLMEDVKKESSRWIKTRGDAYRNFYWQEGYGAFSIGESTIDALMGYFDRQKEHHRHVTFKEEFVQLLKQYHVEYDERYLWD